LGDFAHRVVQPPRDGGAAAALRRLPEELCAPFKAALLDMVSKLAAADPERTSSLIAERFGIGAMPDVLRRLSSSPELQFRYLRSVISPSPSAKTTAQSAFPSPPGGGAGGAGGAAGPGGAAERAHLSVLLGRLGVSQSTELSELYVKLLCQFEPRSVRPFLQVRPCVRLSACVFPLSFSCSARLPQAHSAHLAKRTLTRPLELTITCLQERALCGANQMFWSP
jgi:hypothetical protein